MKKVALLVTLFTLVSTSVFAQVADENVTKKTVEITKCSKEERYTELEGWTIYVSDYPTEIKEAYKTTCEDAKGLKRILFVRYFYNNPMNLGRMTGALRVAYLNSAGQIVFEKKYVASGDFKAAAWSASPECPILIHIVQTRVEYRGTYGYDMSFSTKCNVMD